MVVVVARQSAVELARRRAWVLVSVSERMRVERFQLILAQLVRAARRMQPLREPRCAVLPAVVAQVALLAGRVDSQPEPAQSVELAAPPAGWLFAL